MRGSSCPHRAKPPLSCRRRKSEEDEGEGEADRGKEPQEERKKERRKGGPPVVLFPSVRRPSVRRQPKRGAEISNLYSAHRRCCEGTRGRPTEEGRDMGKSFC